VIRRQETQKINQLTVERTTELQSLRTERMKCEAQGQQKVETCTEKIDHQMDTVRTERDEALSVVRINTEAEIERETAIRHNQLVRVQAQLEEQLKNIRALHYDKIEKVMRVCEGGRAPAGCPELDCSMCAA